MAAKKVPKKKTFSARKEVRAIARERVGRVKPAQVITPESERKPKHKKRFGPEQDEP